MRDIVILIPESEGKTLGGEFKSQTYSSITKELVAEINNYPGDYEKLLGVKGKKLEESISVNKEILSSKTLQAIDRFSGVVYDGISYETLSEKDYFNEKVMIATSMFGLVKPTDKIPNYKLKIDKLGSWKKWLDHNSKIIENKFVIDLLPKTHQKSVSYENGMFIDFIIEKDGKRKPAGHAGKLIKGKFVRFLCENKIKSLKEIAKFNEDGFSFDGTNFVKSN